MNYRSALVLVVACACFVAVVSMSAALQTSVSGTPDDVIDLDTDSLPLPSDEIGDLKSAAQTQDQNGESSDRSQSTDPSDQSSASESDGESESSEPGSSGESGASGSQSSDGLADGSGSNDGTGPEGPVDQLLDLLWTWFERLLGAVGVLLLLAGAGLLIWKRAFLRRQFQRYVGRDTTVPDDDARSGDRTRPPENQIEHSWLEMVSVGAADQNLTPRERADSAVESGLYQEPVRELTSLYEDVRYGDQPVTTSEVQRASTYLQQARGQTDD